MPASSRASRRCVSSSSARAARTRSDAVITLASLIAIVLWDASGLDLAAARWYASGSGFAWRDAWLTSTVLHQGGRVLAWGVLGWMVSRLLAAPAPDGPSRSARWRWLGVTLVCLLLIPAMKRASDTSCPWDLSQFGGTAAYVPHWRFGVADGGPGRCFPSGHAVAAFAFFSIYFLKRDRQPIAARRWLWGVCIVGALFGWAQLARGAHYPSHTLWSAWLCWCLCVVVACREPLRASADPVMPPGAAPWPPPPGAAGMRRACPSRAAAAGTSETRRSRRRRCRR